MSQSATLRRWAARAAGLILAVALAALGAIGWVGSERAIHPGPAQYKRTFKDFPDLHGQSVTMVSRTRIRVSGTFIPGARRATIVLSHGYGDNRELMLPYADFLHRAGFTVLIYDMRNRGRSGGDAVTLGALEAVDLISAIDYLTTRPDVDPVRIGALGVSLGGSVTLMAAARDPRIGAVVDDSGFSDAPRVIDSSFEHFIGLPAFPFAPITVQIASWRAGVSVRAVRPVDDVAKISPRPLLIIHCTGDTVVPPDNSQRILAAAKEPKQVWWVPASGHVQGHKIAKDQYERLVNDFFNSALK